MTTEVPTADIEFDEEKFDRMTAALIEDKPKRHNYIYDDDGNCTYRIDISAKVFHPELSTQEEQAISEQLPESILEVPSNVLEIPISESYQFPYENSDYIVALIQYQGMSAETLKAKLDSLSYVNGKPQDTKHYMENRYEVCAISIVLNMQKRYPPSIRRFWNVGGIASSKQWDSSQTTLLNDLRLIDLHWLYCNKRFNPSAQNSEIFGDTFNFRSASAFAADNKKADTKVLEFGLPYTGMLSLMTLKSKQISERHRTVREQLKRAPSLISEEMLKPSCRLTYSEQKLIDIATATLLADGNHIITGEIYTQITGESIKTEVLRKIVKWLLGKKIINLSKNSKVKQ